MAWNVFSVVSMTYPPAAGAPPACPRFGRDLMLQRLQIHRARQGHTRIELPLLTCHHASKLEEPY